MKRQLKLTALVAAAALLFTPAMMKADRPGARPGGERPATTRPSAGGGNHTMRPGNNRPGNNNNGNRPGNNHAWPGGGQNNWNNGHNNWNPGHNRPNPPSVHPGHGPVNSWKPTPPPVRPYRPMTMRPIPRPMPPTGWRPRPGMPALGGFLGLTFGTSLNISVNYLMSNGFTIDEYADNTVYLRDPRVMNYVWDDGALFYSPAGVLTGSAFYYSTPFYDMNRYNAMFNVLTATYGLPVSNGTSGGVLSATWFGTGGYITLSYNSMASAAGPVRFFTTLTFGN